MSDKDTEQILEEASGHLYQLADDLIKAARLIEADQVLEGLMEALKVWGELANLAGAAEMMVSAQKALAAFEADGIPGLGRTMVQRVTGYTDETIDALSKAKS